MDQFLGNFGAWNSEQIDATHAPRLVVAVGHDTVNVDVDVDSIESVL